MKRETQTVWTGRNDRELLVKKSETEYYVPLSTIDVQTLKELRDACVDAAKDIPDKEMSQPTGGM